LISHREGKAKETREGTFTLTEDDWFRLDEDLFAFAFLSHGKTGSCLSSAR
jgi:hypothetical protein